MRVRINECVVCHKLFKTQSAIAKYCSRECRMRGKNPEWTGGTSRWGHSYEHVCKWCGTKFVSGSPNGNYCSGKCRIQAMKAITEETANTKTIADVVKEADKLGLTYGQYVAYHSQK